MIKKIIIVLLTCVLIALGIICVNLSKNLTGFIIEDNNLKAEIAIVEGKIDDCQKEIASKKEEYALLKIDKENAIKEYENWLRHKQKLEEVLK